MAEPRYWSTLETLAVYTGKIVMGDSELAKADESLSFFLAMNAATRSTALSRSTDIRGIEWFVCRRKRFEMHSDDKGSDCVIVFTFIVDSAAIIVNGNLCSNHSPPTPRGWLPYQKNPGKFNRNYRPVNSQSFVKSCPTGCK